MSAAYQGLQIVTVSVLLQALYEYTASLVSAAYQRLQVVTIYVLLQALYDYTASLAQPAAAASNSQRLQTAQPLMPLLHVEGFDAEQIWLQLDMASAHFVRRARRLLKKAGNEPELLTPEMDEDLEGEWQTLAAFLF